MQSFNVYARLIFFSAVTSYSAVLVVLSALYPFVVQLLTSAGFGALTCDTALFFAFKYCTLSTFVTLFTPELNFIVLLYTTLNSPFPSVIATPNGNCLSSAVPSFLNPIASPPVTVCGVGTATVYLSDVL